MSRSLPAWPPPASSQHSPSPSSLGRPPRQEGVNWSPFQSKQGSELQPAQNSKHMGTPRPSSLPPLPQGCLCVASLPLPLHPCPWPPSPRDSASFCSPFPPPNLVIPNLFPLRVEVPGPPADLLSELPGHSQPPQAQAPTYRGSTHPQTAPSLCCRSISLCGHLCNLR